MRVLDYEWKLRILMAEQGMYSTTDLIPHLRERGINLSNAQVYRLVTGKPERINLAVLIALCDIMGCRQDELLEPIVVSKAQRRRASGTTGSDKLPPPGKARPTRAQISPPE